MSYILAIALLVCYAIVSVRSDATILAASSQNTCFSASVGNIQLNCSQTGSSATILTLRVSHSSDDQQPQSFEFNLATLPLSAGQTQVGTFNECNQPNSLNQCGATRPTKVRISVSDPTVKYDLVQVPNSLVPFLYFYNAADNDCWDPTAACAANRANASCSLISSSFSRSKESVQKIRPIDTQIQAQFAKTIGPFKPGMSMNCPRTGNVDSNSNPYVLPNGTIYNPGDAVLIYKFQCEQDRGFTTDRFTLNLFTAFYALTPMCNVFRIQSPEAVSIITATIVTENDQGEEVQQTATLNTDNYETATATADGQMIIRILNVQNANQYFGQRLPGTLLVCGDTVPVPGLQNVALVPPLSMIPEGSSPLVNPWLNIPQEIRRYSMPTPTLINMMRGSDKPAPNQFFVYYDSTSSFAIGKDCGKLGVNTNLYSDTNVPLYFQNYLGKFGKKDSSSPSFLYSEIIQNFGEFSTCVVGHGRAYNDIAIDTPCQAAAFMTQANNGDEDARRAAYLSEVNGNTDKTRKYMPGVMNAADPNTYIVNNAIYSKTNIETNYEITISAVGTFVGVVGPPVTDGSIVVGAQTSCVYSALDFSAFMSVRVRSGVVESSLDRVGYLVYVSCDPTFGLSIPSNKPSQLRTKNLGFGDEDTVVFSLDLNPRADPNNFKCTAFLGSASTTITFSPNVSMILDQTDIFCGPAQMTKNNSAVIVTGDDIELPDGRIISSKTIDLVITETQHNDRIWLLVGIIITIAVVLVLACSICVVLYTRKTGSPEVVSN